MVKRNSHQRGNIGMIVLLLVLLAVSYLVIQNMQKTGMVTMPGTNAGVAPQTVINKFQGDAKRIEQLQERMTGPVNPEADEDAIPITGQNIK